MVGTGVAVFVGGIDVLSGRVRSNGVLDVLIVGGFDSEVDQLLDSFTMPQIIRPRTAKGKNTDQYFIIMPKTSRPIRATPPPPEFFFAISISLCSLYSNSTSVI
jgi:hypothetical protein